VEFQQKVAEGFEKIVTTLQKNYIKVVDVDEKSLLEVKDEVFRLVDQHFANPSQ
jgi:thymidylate kinase